MTANSKSKHSCCENGEVPKSPIPLCSPTTLLISTNHTWEGDASSQGDPNALLAEVEARCCVNFRLFLDGHLFVLA